MRLTTKIFIGFVAFLFAFTILYALCKQIDYKLDSEMAYIEIPTAKVIQIDSLGYKNKKIIHLTGDINLHNRTNEQKLQINKILAPFVQTRVQADTLFISFVADDIFNLYSYSENAYIRIEGTKISLPVDSTTNITSTMRYLNTNVENITLKEANIVTNGGEISIINSNITTLTTKINKLYEKHSPPLPYKIKNSTIDTFNFDLSNVSMRDSNFENNTIEVLNLIGDPGNYSLYKLPYIKSNKINWLPMNDKSTLAIEFNQPIKLFVVD